MLALHQPRALQLAALIHFALSTSFFIANATPLGNDALTLTARHDEAVCFKGFAWYCASLASACSLSIQDYSGPEKVWYSLPCVVGAICAGNTELVGGLCCMGTVPNCAQDDGASVTRAQNGLHDMPLDIQSMLNGWNLDEPFSKECMRPAFYDLVLEHQGTHANLTDAEYDSTWDCFAQRMADHLNLATPPQSVEINDFNNYLKGKDGNAVVVN